MRFAVVILLVLGLCFGSVVAVAPTNRAAAAVLMDVTSGRVLYANNASERRSIASITKLMTALVALESTADLTAPVEILPEWTGVEGSSLYLEAGEILTMETLLYGLLLRSGNDAATAIAGHCATDEESFVAWMNARAADLGMEDTRFSNPHGLDGEGHYSTAMDMATLAAYCMQQEALREIVATKSITVEGRSIVNHNKLLWNYPGCVGMKTGYTDEAGRTLISSAVREGQTLVCVTLSDPDDWADHTALLDYGFATYPAAVFLEAGDPVGSQRVLGSFLHGVPLVSAEALSYPLTQEEAARAEVRSMLPAGVAAPIAEGGIAGSVQLVLDDEVLAETYVLYAAARNRDVLAENSLLQHALDFLRGTTQEFQMKA